MYIYKHSVLLFTILNLFAYSIFSQEEEAPEPQRISLFVSGEQIIKLNFTPYEKINMNTEIVDYQLIPSRREIVLIGKKPGTVSFNVRQKNVGDVRASFTVTVSTSSQSELVRDLKEYLNDVEGLEIGIKGGKVYLGGEIVVPKDVGRIVKVLEKYKSNDVLELYELSPLTQSVIASRMQDEIHNAGLKDVTVRIVNRVFWLEGVVTSADKRDLALKIAEGFVPDRLQDLAQSANRIQSVRRPIIENFISINAAKQPPPPPPKLLKIVAQFVELSKDYNKIFGFKWTPTLNTGGGQISFGKTAGDGVTTQNSGTFSGTIGNLFPQLASAKSAGYARVIQSGMVIVKDGTKAQITKNTNTPFLLGTGEFQGQANSVNAGFTLDVRTQIIGNERIELGVGISVSQKEANNAETSNKIETNLVVKSKESAVVGGIAINQSKTDYDKNPPFGTDQVEGNTAFPLFSFLRSKAHSINKAQFAVFITPEIIESASQATSEIKTKFRQRSR